MSRTKEYFEELQFQDVLGEEFRAYVHWIEQEEYNRFPVKPDDYEIFDYD